MNNSYITPPPDIPLFLYAYEVSALRNLITWAVKEHRDRVRFCSSRGYYRELKRLNEDYSSIRVLAEFDLLRKVCSMIVKNPSAWNRLTGRERVFIRRALEMGELLR